MCRFRLASILLASFIFLGISPILSLAQTAQSRAESARLMNELMSGKGNVGGPFTLSDQFVNHGACLSLKEKLF